MTVPTRRHMRTPPTWLVLFLAGPVIWYLYFWLVYLVAEAGCSSAWRDSRLLGLPAVSLFVLSATTVAAVATAVLTWLAYRAWRRAGGDPALGDHRRDLTFAGTVVGVLFVVATLFVGVPAVVLQPC